MQMTAAYNSVINESHSKMTKKKQVADPSFGMLRSAIVMWESRTQLELSTFILFNIKLISSYMYLTTLVLSGTPYLCRLST